MRLPLEKASNPLISSSRLTKNSYNHPPLWIQQTGLEWFYIVVCKVLSTLED